MADPLVYVLVINWNGVEHLEDCFESLIASDYTNVRFVLVDNASDDMSVQFIRDRYEPDPRVEILELPRNLGWSGGNNAAMDNAMQVGADYILLLNNDTRIAPDAINKLVALAESDAEIGALAPKLLMFYEDQILNSLGLEASTVGASWDRGIGRLDGPKWSGITEVAGVCGAGMFLRAAALHKSGLLPRDFDIYLDDLDLSLRIWDAGYRVLTCPEAVVWHKFSATMGEGKRARRKYYLNTRNRARIILRNYPQMEKWSIALDFGLGEVRAVGRALLDGEFWKLRVHLQSWIAAFFYLDQARVARHERHGRGLGEGCYWHLIRRRPQFFEGTLFPENGWYPEVEVDGESYRPIAGVATYAHPGGSIEIRQTNPFARLGSVSIEVRRDGRLIGTLSGNEARETRLDIEQGEIEFVAQSIFDSDETGLTYDCGGWLRVRSNP